MGTETSGDCPGRYLLNPAVVGEVDLPGLDEVGVLVFQAQSFWYRLERLILYVAGTGIMAVIAFTAGFFCRQ